MPQSISPSSHYSFLNKEAIKKDINREWLVTNGLGSYASGTISGILTRRYHGLMVIAENPPLGRILYVTKIEEEVEIDNRKYLLSSNKWKASEEEFPKGYEHIELFYLDQNIPTWQYKLEDILIEKKIFMENEKNSIHIRYKLLKKQNNSSIKLTCNIFVNNRDFHALNKEIKVKSIIKKNKIEFLSEKNDFLFFAYSNFSELSIKDSIYYNYDLDEEKKRGFDHIENHKLAASLITLMSSENSNPRILLSSEKKINKNSDKILYNLRKKNKDLLLKFSKLEPIPKWISQLVLAANAFIVNRPHSKDASSKSIIAGYHWFGDWGRDTMISLPGLCCSTEQYTVAKSILENYSKYIDKGMLPNRFPDYDETPDYNTADATLWYFEAISNYLKSTNDLEFLKNIYPILEEIIHYHIVGTRFQIKYDEKDGLIYAGEKGLQLTWMDAKINGLVVTPRTGKPIEINALWYNALKNMNEYAIALGKENNSYLELAKKVELGMMKYWNEEAQYCYDVLETPEGNDISLRPNQIIALSLTYCPFGEQQKKSILDICGRHLVTYYGLRSLGKHAKEYKGRYEGNPYERDTAYHQGTAWSWLLGVFSISYFNVTKNASVALAFLEPLAKHINEAGVGYISEIFDGGFPFQARGCIAQAWGVAETLRAWKIISPHLEPLKRENQIVSYWK